jgi:hypothetical protein
MTAFIAGFKAELWHSGARQLRQLMVKETAVTEAGLLTVLCSSPHLGRRESTQLNSVFLFFSHNCFFVKSLYLKCKTISVNLDPNLLKDLPFFEKLPS